MTTIVRVVDPPVRCRCAQPADGAPRPPGRWVAASRRVRPIAGVDCTAASGTGTADRCATAGALHYGIRERHPVREPHPAREGLRRTLALRRSLSGTGGSREATTRPRCKGSSAPPRRVRPTCGRRRRAANHPRLSPRTTAGGTASHVPATGRSRVPSFSHPDCHRRLRLLTGIGRALHRALAPSGVDDDRGRRPAARHSGTRFAGWCGRTRIGAPPSPPVGTSTLPRRKVMDFGGEDRPDENPPLDSLYQRFSKRPRRWIGRPRAGRHGSTPVVVKGGGVGRASL